MKKAILLSGATILAVAAVVAGATTAFFSDTETSKGNTFTAGAIDLMIDNESYYNGYFSTSTSWLQPKDLGEGDWFFHFMDLKPGDWGEDTISVHVDNNDSWLCADVTLTKDDDMSSTEPELDDGDVLEATSTWDGELADAVNFIWWADDGDNVLETCRDREGQVLPECVEEVLLPSGPLGVLSPGGTATVTLADSTHNIWGTGPLPGGSMRYIGKAWCFGKFDLTTLPLQDGMNNVRDPSMPGMGVMCDGSGVNNMTQTDSMMADISFRAVQSRNNMGYECNPD